MKGSLLINVLLFARSISFHCYIYYLAANVLLKLCSMSLLCVFRFNLYTPPAEPSFYELSRHSEQSRITVLIVNRAFFFVFTQITFNSDIFD